MENKDVYYTQYDGKFPCIGAVIQIKTEMTQIILRSIAVGLFVSVASFFHNDYMLQPNPEFVKYCQTTGFDDPECIGFNEQDNEEIKKIRLVSDLYYVGSEFVIAFLGAFIFGLWLYFYPVKGFKNV